MSKKKNRPSGERAVNEEIIGSNAAKKSLNYIPKNTVNANRAERRRRAKHLKRFLRESARVAEYGLVCNEPDLTPLGAQCLTCALVWRSSEQVPPSLHLLMRARDGSAGKRVGPYTTELAAWASPICATCAALPDLDERIRQSIEAHFAGARVIDSPATGPGTLQ